MGRGGLTPPPLQTAPGCGGQWCWSVFFSLLSSQRERKRSHQRVKSLARSHQSQESRVNVTWAHQNLRLQTPRSTLALENAPVGGTSRGTTALAARRGLGPCSAGSQCTSSATRSRTWAVLGCATTSTPSLGRATRASLSSLTRTARGATRTVGSVSRTRSLDQTRRRGAAAKQGRTRSTARPSKGIASISATVIPTPLARKANVGKFGQYWQCECNKGYTGNGIQCMDGDGNLSAQPGQQVEVTLTMTAGLYEDAPVENEFSHGDAMESLLDEM